MTGNSATLGTMTVEALESRQITQPTVGSAVVDVDRCLYRWRPSEQIRGELPENYCVSLEAMSHKGVRRLYPDNPPDFLSNASLGGLAILSRTENLTGEQRSSYNLMRLLVQYGPSVQEALDRTFSRRVDLLVLGYERFDLDFSNILPDNLGLDSLGKGKRWSVADLLKAGRDSAKARDLAEPSTADLIRLGLVEAARRDPFDVTQLKTEEASGILRLALFDVGPAEMPISDETRREVEGRLLDSLRPHLDDSAEDFDRWFFKNRDGIVHQISKRKAKPGPIDRAVVRDVLLELVFASLKYTGQCIGLQMQNFLNVIDPPLSGNERGIFELLYLGQPWLGGIPLALLHRYFRPLREAIQDLWADPGDAEKQGVLLRVLYFHAEMVRKRREADRAIKRAADAPKRKEVDVASRSEIDRSEGKQKLDLNELGIKLMRNSGAKCECGAVVEFTRFDCAGATANAVEVEAVCGECGKTQMQAFSYDDVRKASREDD